MMKSNPIVPWLVAAIFSLFSAVTCTAQTPVQPASGTPVALPNLDFGNGLNSWMLRDSIQLDAVYQAATTPEGKPALSIHLGADAPARLKSTAYIARNDFPTTAGYYQLQFSMQTDLQSGSAGFHIVAQNTDNTYAQILNVGQGGAPPITGKTAWTNYFVVYHLPEDAASTIVQIEANGAQGTMYVADISLQRLSDETGKALMQQINPQAVDAHEYGAKMVATPSRVVNAIGNKLIYQPPGLDHSILVFNSCTSAGAGSAIFVDYIKHTSTVIPLPAGSGGWDIIETAPGKLLFESLEPLYLVTIDTTGGHYKIVSNVSVEKSTYAWSFSKGQDGMIYFGSYPTGHAYRYNPQTLQVDDLGYIGPEENLYVRYTAVDSHGFLLCAVDLSTPSTNVRFLPK